MRTEIVRPCPQCGELIAPDSSCCSHCHISNPFSGRRRRGGLVWVLSVLLLTGFIFYISFMEGGL